MKRGGERKRELGITLAYGFEWADHGVHYNRESQGRGKDGPRFVHAATLEEPHRQLDTWHLQLRKRLRLDMYTEKPQVNKWWIKS